MVLNDYESQSKTNAHLMTTAQEFVYKSYKGSSGNNKISDILKGSIGFLRNIVVEQIDSSDFLKYNFMMYASGSITHPSDYEWKKVNIGQV